MSHELQLVGMFVSADFGVGDKRNQHHAMNHHVIEGLPEKNASGEASYYIHRGMFHVVDGSDCFRSQVILFGNSFKETDGFIEEWLMYFEQQVLSRLIGIYAFARFETELDGTHNYQWLAANKDVDRVFGEPPLPARNWKRSGGRGLSANDTV